MMLITPLQRTTLRPRRRDGALIKPRTSSVRGQAWGVLASHYRPETGQAQVALPSLLSCLDDGYYPASIAAFSTPHATHIALLFGDSSLLVGWVDAPIPPLPQKYKPKAMAGDYAPYTVVFSPLVFSAAKSKLSHHRPGHGWFSGITRIHMDPGIQPDQLARELTNAVQEARSWGRLGTPWDSAPGGFTAPWILGGKDSPTILDLAKAALITTYGPDVHQHPRAFHVYTPTLNDKGGINWHDIALTSPKWADAAGLERCEAWLQDRMQRPGCPIPATSLLGHTSNMARFGRKESARTARGMSIWPPHIAPTAHEHMRLCRLYQDACGW